MILRVGLKGIVLMFIFWMGIATAFSQEAKPPNVLLICIDDLLPALGCYGNAEVISPHIDSLAVQSALFTKHYVTVPTCGASRYSLLRSNLPKSKEALGNGIANKLSDDKSKKSPQPETFIEQFRRNGYHTVGIGKISHSPDGYIYPYNAPKSNRKELPNSWDELLFDEGKWEQGWNAFFGYADGTNRTSKQGNVPPYEIGEVDDEGYVDGLTATLAVSKLRELSRQDKPFFLGVGFFKPHLPFNAPKKYWDLYKPEQLILTPTPDLPQNVHELSLHDSGEFNQYLLGEEKVSLAHPLSETYARKLLHGYYACVSYVDTQVGKLLAALKETGLDATTIVVLWSDHGWHLGDYGVWGKHTLFDRSLRSVLILKTPEMISGRKINEVVSTIDIAPTLLELCDIPPLPQADGQSMVALWMNREGNNWKNVAYSYFKNGISMVTPQYRFTQYFRDEQPTVELYDHHIDPFETENIAPEKPKLVEELKKLWHQGNTGLFK